MLHRRLLLLMLPLVLALMATAPALAGSPAAPPSDPALDVVHEGYTDLLALYMDPLSPSQVLTDAWSGATAAAFTAGVAEAPDLGALPDDRDAAWSAFATAFTELEQDGQGLIDGQDLAYAALGAMTANRHECHTYFMPPAVFAQFRAELQGRNQFVGIGVQVSQHAPFSIVTVFPDSPAQRAGLMPGDVILAVNGIPATEQTLQSLNGLIRGEEGTAVTLTVMRRSEPAPLDITVVRGVVSIPVLTSTLRPDGIGVIQLTAFTANGQSEQMLRDALADLTAQGARGWVLDLRANGGGSADSVYQVLGAFLPPETPVLTVDRRGERTTFQVEGEEAPAQLPLAVLIGPGSASGAEIVAAVLQDTGRARIFGQQSAGCVNLGVLRGLPDGSGMSITGARVLAGPRERVLDGAGVTPDEQTPDGPGDPALAAAVAYLLRGAPVAAGR